MLAHKAAPLLLPTPTASLNQLLSVAPDHSSSPFRRRIAMILASSLIALSSSLILFPHVSGAVKPLGPNVLDDPVFTKVSFWSIQAADVRRGGARRGDALDHRSLHNIHRTTTCVG